MIAPVETTSYSLHDALPISPVLTVSAAGLPAEVAPRAVMATTDAGTALEANAAAGVGVVARGGVASLLIGGGVARSEEHTSELQSPCKVVCRLSIEIT